MRLTLGLVFVIFSIALIGAAYWFGAFSTPFNINMCYSEVIREIQKGAMFAASSSDDDAVSQFQSKLNVLPVRGYESDCKEIKNAEKNL